MHRYPLLLLALLTAALAGCSDDEAEGTCTPQNTVDDGDAVSERQALTRQSAARVTQAVRDLHGDESVFEVLLTLADGELAAVYGRRIAAEEPLTVLNLFRLGGGKILDRWEARQAASLPTPDHPGFERRPEALDGALARASRALVRDFVETALVDEDIEASQAYLGVDLALEPRATASVQRLLHAESADGKRLQYRRVRRVIAEADFVLTQSDGELDGQAHAIYDVFRVDGRYVAEHLARLDSPEWR